MIFVYKNFVLDTSRVVLMKKDTGVDKRTNIKVYFLQFVFSNCLPNARDSWIEFPTAEERDSTFNDILRLIQGNG